MTIVIRPYVPADAPVLLELFRRSVREVASADYSPEQVRAWAPDDLDVETFARRRAAAGTWVAERDGAVAGFTDLSDDGYIDMFFVHPEHARRGVATALMAHVLGEARRRGLARLTVAASITARPLFERSGFTVVREQRVERGGQWFTNYAMQRVEGATAEDGPPPKR
ncbi:GNAT family N-acetyltransferase [Pyxidicoccus fallax]|uniref:GNAT family N-acetyltransferase n=1 Tax=Pyxidicoccus fallax TaxID=394095 RepID=UPI0014940C51|nr:GNAT family N-acetyltransferase [Pyxidicoccus fallax]